jgi:four helix bundle protein
MGDYTKLEVWKKSHKLAIGCHKAARKFRGTEYLSLKKQLITAAFSIPSNIVEGNGIQSAAEYARFVRTAINSCDELEYHLTTATELGMLDPTLTERFLKARKEIAKMLNGLLKYLERRKAEEERRKEEMKEAQKKKRDQNSSGS